MHSSRTLRRTQRCTNLRNNAAHPTLTRPAPQVSAALSTALSVPIEEACRLFAVSTDDLVSAPLFAGRETHARVGGKKPVLSRSRRRQPLHEPAPGLTFEEEYATATLGPEVLVDFREINWRSPAVLAGFGEIDWELPTHTDGRFTGQSAVPLIPDVDEYDFRCTDHNTRGLRRGRTTRLVTAAKRWFGRLLRLCED